MKLIADFLSDLKQNNNKLWFDAHKAEYKAALDAFTQIVAAGIEEVSRAVEPLDGLRPQDCVYRIYRDVRFSPDKTPYKSHFAAFIGPGGRKSEAGIYFHFSPDSVFMGFGEYQPDGEQIKGLRQELDYNFGEFQKLINSQKFKAFWGEPKGEKLKTLPKGYQADNAAIEYLKFKQMYFGKELSPKDFTIEKFPKILAEGMQLAIPVRDFLKNAVGKGKEEK